jgi:hypothetical protein
LLRKPAISTSSAGSQRRSLPRNKFTVLGQRRILIACAAKSHRPLAPKTCHNPVERLHSIDSKQDKSTEFPLTKKIEGVKP